MEINKKALEVYNIVDKIYPDEIEFLEFANNFQTLISVILSAQTTDRQVNIVKDLLYSTYPDSKALAQAKQSDVEKIIHSLGFYKTKAKNIILTSKLLESDYNGEIPSEMQQLLKFPGVGRKSANVVLGHCYNKPAIIVDTHFKRVVYRLGLTVEKDPTKVEFDIREILPLKYHYRFSMTINYHGRERCFARNPNCDGCKLGSLCTLT